MHMISAPQVKAARAMLDWSQGTLAAKAGVCLTTIRSLETGCMPRHHTLQKIVQAFEDAGLMFTESDGVKRRGLQVALYRGQDGCDRFFDDMLQTVKQTGGEVVAAFKSKDILMKACSTTGNNLGHLDSIRKITNIRCLVPEPLDAALQSPNFQYRILPHQQIGTISYFSYVGRYVIIMPEGGTAPSFLVVMISELAEAYKVDFSSAWNQAVSPLALSETQPHRRLRAL